jgi:hypothetical protein
MGMRTASVSIVVFVALIPQVVHATSGSPEVVAYHARLPEAKKNPTATIDSFKKAPADNKERMVLFMLVMTLGESKLIQLDEYRQLVDRGLLDVHEHIRGHAVHYVDNVHEDETRQQIYRRCTFDKSLLVRYNAAEQMRDYPSEESVAYLDGLLDDESIEVRDRAAGTLCSWHRSGSVPGIKEVFLRSLESENIRRAGVAARVLATFFEMPPHLDVLNAYLNAELDKSPPEFGGDNARAVIRLLGRISDPSSKPVLQKATQYPNRYVGADAQEALSKITMEPK